MRKEVRGIAVCTPAHIVDRIGRDPGVSKLKSNQCGEVAVRLGGTASDHGATVRGLLHLASDFFADFECFDANVGPDRDHEVGRIVGQRSNGLRNDTGHSPAPPRMHGANVSARWMRDQDRHTIGRPCCHRAAFGSRDECVALHVGNGLSDIGLGDLAHLRPMHLPLLEEPIAINPEALGKARAVLAYRVVVITQVKTEVQSVIRRGAHSTRTRSKCVMEPMPIQKRGMESTHSVLCSMVRLREPLLHAKEALPKPGQGVW